jgi:hypothetical protein
LTDLPTSLLHPRETGVVAGEGFKEVVWGSLPIIPMGVRLERVEDKQAGSIPCFHTFLMQQKCRKSVAAEPLNSTLGFKCKDFVIVRILHGPGASSGPVASHRLSSIVVTFVVTRIWLS